MPDYQAEAAGASAAPDVPGADKVEPLPVYGPSFQHEAQGSWGEGAAGELQRMTTAEASIDALLLPCWVGIEKVEVVC
jgi:hypothetical protein